jgi:hypothetical protein
MADLDELRAKLAGIAADLRAAVDMTIELRARSPQHKGAAIKVWEDFLSGFFGYIKQRSREAKDNLLAGVSWTRMKLF